MTREVVAFDIDETIDAEAVFANVITGPHQIATRADVLLDGEVVVEGSDSLALTGGNVVHDRRRAIIGSCTVTIADPVRVPVAADDVLTPYGYELRLWRGVSVHGGQIMAPLGVFPIQRSSVAGVMLLSTIQGNDRSRTVSDTIFEDTYQVASGTNYATAIREIVEFALPNVEFLFPSTPFDTPTLTFGPQDDRWEAVQGMARSLGNEILFDGLGRCVMRAEPTFQDEPVGVMAESVNLIGLNVELDRGPAYNKVIATSSNASLTEPYRGEAFDNDPSSPTYYEGPFGKKARRYSSPFLASNAQCDSAAAAILASNLGVAKSVTATVLPDPRRELSDVVQVVRSPLAIDELHIVDQVSLGLAAPDVLSADVRAQQVAA